MTCMPGHNPHGALKPLMPREGMLRAFLAADVRTLSLEIGERNVGHPRAYAAAANWTASQIREAGLQVHALKSFLAETSSPAPRGADQVVFYSLEFERDPRSTSSGG